MNTKYRGYSIKNNQWVFGDLRHYKGDVWIVNDEIKEKVYPYSVGMHIGRTDKNGEEIYVGHLIKISYTYPANDGEHTTEQMCRVMWSDEQMAVVTDWGTDSETSLHQVIIAFNPEIQIVGDVFDTHDDYEEYDS